MSALDPKTLDRIAENTSELKVLVEKLLQILQHKK